MDSSPASTLQRSPEPSSRPSSDRTIAKNLGPPLGQHRPDDDPRRLTIRSSAGRHELIQLIQADRSLEITTIHPSSPPSPSRSSTDRLLSRLLSCKSRRAPPREAHLVHIDYQFLLSCKLTTHKTDDLQHSIRIELAFLKTSDHRSFKLETLAFEGLVDRPQTGSNRVSPLTWVENVLSSSYECKGLPRTRRLLILINPASGSKKSLKIWTSIVEPILKSSICTYHVIFTTHSGHAAEIAEQMNVDAYDVVSCVSGDGMLHEFLNGLGRRKTDARRALDNLFLCSIPAGSGNALSTNHLGPQQSKNAYLATLNLLKGRPIRLDLCSTTQLIDGNDRTEHQESEPERRLSFLSTSFGLAADLDVGTDSWRWMGPTRFVIGYIWGAIVNKQHRIRLDVQLVSDDKQEIERNFHQIRQTILNRTQDAEPSWHRDRKSKHDDQVIVDTHSSTSSFSSSNGFPSLKFGDIRTNLDCSEDSSTNPWTTIETQVISLYAGTLPYVAPDLMQFPAKIPGHDGTIDIALQNSKNTWSTLASISGAEAGKTFMHKDFRFLKVKAFRLTPLSRSNAKKGSKSCIDQDLERQGAVVAGGKKGSKKMEKERGSTHIALDGEELAYRPIQVEIHEKLLKTLTLTSPPSSINPHPQAPYYFGSIGVPDRLL